MQSNQEIRLLKFQKLKGLLYTHVAHKTFEFPIYWVSLSAYSHDIKP